MTFDGEIFEGLKTFGLVGRGCTRDQRGTLDVYSREEAVTVEVRPPSPEIPEP